MVRPIDISGSMAPHADSLLRLSHRVLQGAQQHGEVFTLDTRLAGRHPARGDLRAFNDRWGLRAVARSAVVIVAGNGWERGDPGLPRRQVERLHHLARAVIWVNPHREETAANRCSRESGP